MPRQGKHLSWLHSFLAPYESGAIIFRKVMAINNISQKKLIELIKLPEMSEREEYTGSSWIDFEKYGELLRVNPETLRQGFLDQSGFSMPRRRIQKSFDLPLRCCPQCIDKRYECVFFDLRILSECPWHRCALAQSEDHMRPNLGLPLILWEPTVIKVNYEQLLHELSQNECATALGYCLELARWRTNIRSGMEGLEHFTAPIDETVEAIDYQQFVSKEYRTSKAMWSLGMLKSCEQERLFWKIPECPYAASLVRLKDLHRAQTVEERCNHIEQDTTISGPIGRIYRSIKHQIYKRYVRGHKECLKQLIKMNMDEVRSLDGDFVCPIAVAYILWRMSHEGVGNIEAFSKRRLPGYKLRIMGPDFWAGPFLRLEWSHISYNALVILLVELLGKRKLSVVLNSSHKLCRGYLVCEWHEDALGMRTHYVAHPAIDPTYFLEKCKHIKSTGEQIRLELIDKAIEWDYISMPGDGDVVMQFQWPRSIGQNKYFESYWIEI